MAIWAEWNGFAGLVSSGKGAGALSSIVFYGAIYLVLSKLVEPRLIARINQDKGL